jgi:hypothetical protein
MSTTNNEAYSTHQNPYYDFVILLDELESEGFFTESGTGLGNHEIKSLLECYFIS